MCKASQHLLFLWLAIFPVVGIACTCELQPALFKKSEKQRVAIAIKQSQAVFSGKVIEINISNKEGREWPVAEVKFEVLRAWKGVKEKTVVVHTAAVCCICGYEFKEGQTYLVYAYNTGDKSGHLGTNICTRTRVVGGAESELKILDDSMKRQARNF